MNSHQQIEQMNFAFLDHQERRNSKTFYYIRLASIHKIPYVVENQTMKNYVMEECYRIYKHQEIVVYDVNHFILRPKSTIYEILHQGSMIADNLEVRKKMVKFDPYLGDKIWMSDDQIRNFILTDMSEGKEDLYL